MWLLRLFFRCYAWWGMSIMQPPFYTDHDWDDRPKIGSLDRFYSISKCIPISPLETQLNDHLQAPTYIVWNNYVKDILPSTFIEKRCRTHPFQGVPFCILSWKQQLTSMKYCPGLISVAFFLRVSLPLELKGSSCIDGMEEKFSQRQVFIYWGE